MTQLNYQQTFNNLQKYREVGFGWSTTSQMQTKIDQSTYLVEQTLKRWRMNKGLRSGVIVIINWLSNIMMRKLLRSSLQLFSKLNQEALAKLRLSFQQNPTPAAFAEYLTPHNTQPLFQIVIQSKISPQQSNAVLNSLLNLCTTDTDEQLNVLANILKQRGINNMRIGDLPSAISDFQQAISTVLLMTQPSQLVLAQFYKFIADLYLQMNDLKKGQKALLQAENLLLELQGMEGSDQWGRQTISSGLACIYTQMCMIKYRDRRPKEALELLLKAEQHWQNVKEKILKEYELTCRLKCMIHILFNQNDQALQSAQIFLNFLKASPQYSSGVNRQMHDLTSLYYLNIICSFKPDPSSEKQQVLQLLRQIKSQKGQKRLLETMAIMGIKQSQYPL